MEDSSGGTRRKLALIIGNSAYEREENRIQNCLENTNRLATLLRGSDFRVEVYHNCRSQEHIVECIQTFVELIKEDDVILAYYCGHGCHHNGTNYLVPTDDKKINNYDDIEDFALKAESLIDRLAEKKSSYANILLFDCCRPYELKERATTMGNMLDQ